MSYLLIVDDVVTNVVNADIAFLNAWKQATPNSSYVLSKTAAGVGVNWVVSGVNSYTSQDGDTVINNVYTYKVKPIDIPTPEPVVPA